MKIVILFLMVLIFVSYTNCNSNEGDSFCEREGQTICQAFCSPVSFKKCKKNITSQNYNYCCVCEFWQGDFKTECIPVNALEF